MKIAYLAHHPPVAHQHMMKELGAETILLPFKRLVELTKKIPPLGYLYPFISALYSLTLKAEYDVIIVDGGSAVFTGASLKKRKKCILIYLDADLMFYFMTKRKPLQKKSIEFFTKEIDGALCVSEVSKHYLKKSLTIPAYVTNPFPQSIEIKNIQRKPYGLYVGRLVPEKNIKRIIKIGAACPYFEKFIVVGSGIMESYVKAQARKNNKIVWYPHQKDIGKFYQECTFLLHLPDFDPFPVTTLEAAMAGCFPIIGKGVGTKNVWGNYFTIQNPEDKNEVYSKIKCILDHQDEANTALREAKSKILDKKTGGENFVKTFQKLLKEIQYHYE